jgi:hypothetical protein
MTEDAVDLREYVDALFREKELAEIERATAAAALQARTDREIVDTCARLRDMIKGEHEFTSMMMAEQQRALDVAEQEREKAAQLLHKALERQIDEGDRHLQDHIITQIEQIRNALVAANNSVAQQFAAIERRLDGMADLSTSRLEGLLASIEAREQASRERLLATQREAQLIQQASQDAIAKADNATEKRFEAVNAFRQQLSDQASRFLPREVAETQFAEMRRTIAEMSEKVGKLV